MKVKLSDAASIAEVIGAIAIVVSLIYVGIQVEDSTRAVRSATANDTTTSLSSWYRGIATDPESSRIYQDGMTNPETLSRGDLFRYMFLVHAIMLELQATYYLAAEGTLDVELQESITNTLIAVKDQPGFVHYWEQRNSLFQTAFRRYTDAIIASDTSGSPIPEIYQPLEAE